MKIVFKIKEDDGNPVIADCTGDNAATRGPPP
jgi:hypothetical protein